MNTPHWNQMRCPSCSYIGTVVVGETLWDLYVHQHRVNSYSLVKKYGPHEGDWKSWWLNNHDPLNEPVLILGGNT